MAIIKLKKGFDLRLEGQIGDGAQPVRAAAGAAIGIVPDDFEGIVPRMDVRPGDTVLAGQVLYHDKTHEAIKVTSPVAGTVKDVCRGERRKILAVVIEPDGKQPGEVTFDVKRPIKELLLESGLWVMLRQRPYDVVPNPDVTPRDIFVTAFDSAPLAVNRNSLSADEQQLAEVAVKALSTLTPGKVYIGISPSQDINVSGAVINTFDGPHPAGNAGVQIANVKPVNKGETIWTLSLDTLLRIGTLLSTGRVDYNVTVAVAGPMVAEPKLVSTTIGASIDSVLAGNIKAGAEPRLIAGNVLSGVKVELDGYIRAPYTQLSVIAENNDPDEFMGWAALSPKRFSIYRLFTSWLAGLRSKPTNLDARIKGGERAIVRLDEYDDMLPMDIYAEFLIKAIIARNIERMEELGIYEVAPEDFALAEFADTSKLELQRIVRDGLTWLRGEME